VSGRLDDKGLTSRPTCEGCGNSPAAWTVTSKLGPPMNTAVTQKLCTGCAKATGGRRKALKARDY
jgi:hypothetical protein